MFVGSPLGESRQVLEDALAVGMEDMRPVAVHQHAMRVVLVVGVTCDVRSSVDQQHATAGIGQFTGYDAAGVAGSDDEVIKVARHGQVRLPHQCVIARCAILYDDAP